MKKMGQSNILISGMKGLGVEIGEPCHCVLCMREICEDYMYTVHVCTVGYCVLCMYCDLLYTVHVQYVLWCIVYKTCMYCGVLSACFTAKNVILGGVKSVTVHDTEAATVEDLSSQVACVHTTHTRTHVQTRTHHTHVYLMCSHYMYVHAQQSSDMCLCHLIPTLVLPE